MYNYLDCIIYTIGHSDREIDNFLEILQQIEVDTLVDIRSHPQSRRYPQFNESVLRDSLQKINITYHWAGRHLGGKRKPVNNSPHTSLVDKDLRGFADHMDTDIFKKAAAQLINLAQTDRLAILCTEKFPEQCHRSLLADYLTLKGPQLVHLTDVGKQYLHQLSSLARRESSELIYDANTSGLIGLN